MSIVKSLKFFVPIAKQTESTNLLPIDDVPTTCTVSYISTRDLSIFFNLGLPLRLSFFPTAESHRFYLQKTKFIAVLLIYLGDAVSLSVACNMDFDGKYRRVPIFDKASFCTDFAPRRNISDSLCQTYSRQRSCGQRNNTPFRRG